MSKELVGKLVFLPAKKYKGKEIPPKVMYCAHYDEQTGRSFLIDGRGTTISGGMPDYVREATAEEARDQLLRDCRLAMYDTKVVIK